MEGLKQKLISLDIKNLLKIFNVQISVVTILIFFLLSGVFAKIIIKIINKIKKSDENAKESGMYIPLKTFFTLIGIYIAIKMLPVNSQVMIIANHIFKVVLIIFITKCITSLISPKSRLFKSFFNVSNSHIINNFLCMMIRGVIWIISFFIILYMNKINLNGLAAGLGIGSAALALAAQDLVKSILCGIAILTDKPFNIGDWIEVGNFAGTVTDITFRSTRIKALNNTIITIPNSTIASEYVINWNRLSTRRFSIILGLSLETTPEKIKKITKQMKLVLEQNPKVVPNSVQVHFDNITAYSNEIKIYLYVTERELEKFLEVKQELLCELLTLIEKENIELAYPTQTLLVKNQEIAEDVIVNNIEES